MKPIEYYKKIDFCNYCGGCMGTNGVPQFSCNKAKHDSAVYTSPCTKEDFKGCPMKQIPVPPTTEE